MEIKNDFSPRAEEVEIYFAFARQIDVIETNRQKEIKINEASVLLIKRDLQKILRANCYLILYNLIEATIRNGIWAIYDTIEDNKIAYEKLSKLMQNVWLTDKASEITDISNNTRLKNNVKSLLDERLSGEGIKFSKTRISLSGNLDYKSIEKLINEYGFHGKIRIKDKTKLSKALLRIKHERNSLAHGNKSFRQSAEIVTIQELFEYKDLVISYLSDITDNITKYLENESYLKP